MYVLLFIEGGPKMYFKRSANIKNTIMREMNPKIEIRNPQKLPATVG